MTTLPLTPPPLDVQLYHVLELHFAAREEYAADQISSAGINVDFDVQRSDSNPHEFRITMTIGLAEGDYAPEDNPPYTISLRIVGYFIFVAGTEETKMQRMIHLNGSSILYGIARGLIGQATGASIHGQFVLPAVNFVSLVQSRADQRAPIDPRTEASVALDE